MASSGLKTFLHFAGDRYFPLVDVPGTRHFLLIDSTYRYWRGDDDLPKSFVDDVDADMRRAYGQMEHIFAIGEHAKEGLIADYGISPGKVTVVGTGRGVIKTYNGAKDYSNGAILFVARARFSDKGGPLLLEAFKLARARDPRLQLWAVGDDELKRAAEGAEGVKVMGFLSLGELQGLFEKASLFAMPAGREPWGLVYLEAMVCKTPVLGLARGAVPEITGNGEFGFAVKDATAAGVAAALVDAFSDSGRLEKMGLAGQAYCVEHFTWDKMVDRMLAKIDAA